MDKVDSQFRKKVYEYVRQIPNGRVMTYGQLAALAGYPYAARVVGGIAHWGDPSLPWQRVVKKSGSLAEGYPGGLSGHKQVLEAEGVEVTDDYRVNVEELLWYPPNPGQNSLL
jgi:methylated-DNA-protein-cysteine methyltransferase-like protein